jgi:hypothetical protein
VPAECPRSPRPGTSDAAPTASRRTREFWLFAGILIGCAVVAQLY